MFLETACHRSSSGSGPIIKKVRTNDILLVYRSKSPSVIRSRHTMPRPRIFHYNLDLSYHASPSITFHQPLRDLNTDNPSILKVHQKIAKIWAYSHIMPSKRKSVTFRENISEVSPAFFDGSSSPAPITNAPATAHPSLELDPMYLTWLRSATKAQYPFIVNGTFAKHVYHQNFDKHYNMKQSWQFQRVEEREAAVSALAEKYGPLGWGSLYDKVNKEAWVKNYRVESPSCVSGWMSS